MKNQKLISKNVIRRFLNGTGSSGVLTKYSEKDIIDINGSKYLNLGNNKIVLLHTNKSSNYPNSITASNGRVTYYYNPRSAILASYSDLKKIENHYEQNKYYDTNVSTSGNNIFSQQRTNDRKFTLSKVKNFKENVIDYLNSHSTYNDIKSTIPTYKSTLLLGNVPVDKNGLLFRETIPNIETTMPISIFTKRNPTLLITSNSTKYRLPSSLSEYRSLTLNSSKRTSETQPVIPETKQYSELEKAVGIKGFLNLLANGYDFTTAGIIINGSSPSLLLELYDKTSNLFTKPKEEKKELEITTPVRTIPYNRADIRSLIRNAGYNPYSDYSAGLRRKLRKYLNKEDNQLYEDWMAPFVVFKKKGGLISKNIVTRFKNKI